MHGVVIRYRIMYNGTTRYQIDFSVFSQILFTLVAKFLLIHYEAILHLMHTHVGDTSMHHNRSLQILWNGKTPPVPNRRQP